MASRRSTPIVTAAAATLLTVGPVLAQPAQPATQSAPPAARQPESQRVLLLHANRLIGKAVMNRQGARLGTVQDVVLTPDGDRVDYVVLSRGGVAGVGNKLFAVPWDAVKVGLDNQPTVDIAPQKLDQAPGFDKNSWPDKADPIFQQAAAPQQPQPGVQPQSSAQQGASLNQQIEAQQNQPPAGATSANPAQQQYQRSQELGAAQTPATPGSRLWWDQQLGIQRGAGSERQVYPSTPPQQAVPNQPQARQNAAPMQDEKFVHANVWTRRVSKILGTTVRDSQDKNLGEIRDVVIAPGGQVRFAVISTGGFLGVNEKMLTLPWNAVQLNPRQTTAMLNMTRNKALAMATPPNQMPDLNNPAVASRIESQYGPGGIPVVGEQAFGMAGGAAAASAWAAGGAVSRAFNANTVTTVNGTVQSVNYFLPEPNAPEGLRLTVQSDQGPVNCYVGPAEFLANNGVRLQPGDRVTLTGSRTSLFGEPALLVSQLQKGNQTIQLLSPQGQPLYPVPQQQGSNPGQQQPGARSVSPVPSPEGQTGTGQQLTPEQQRVQQQQALPDSTQPQQTQPGERR